MNSSWSVTSAFTPAGDQPKAIEALLRGLEEGQADQVLLGVTGSGKTFTMAQVIAQAKRPALIMAHNKTLAAQLYQEMKNLLPEAAVEYFVSYYDYYQPEAYVPSSDTFIEKDSSINEEIDRLRHRATRSLLTREDVVVVASVSCIYGIGSAEAWAQMLVTVEEGQTLDRKAFLYRLIEASYERNDVDFHRGCFRVRGDTVEVYPAHEDSRALRIEFFGDEVERISAVDSLTGQRLEQLPRAAIFPASHYVIPPDQMHAALTGIRDELGLSLRSFSEDSKLLEEQRLRERTLHDLEMIEQTGRCPGIENYSRWFSGRSAGQPPPTLFEYLPDNAMLMVDESHVTVGQIRAMFKGDRSRKTTLVDHGFRLPSALDNRPLRFDEWDEGRPQTVFVSATPGDFELERTAGVVVEQVVRPTGLLDPTVEIRPVQGQVDDLLDEIRQRVAKDQRVLVTTLTKRMAENLADYYAEVGVRVRYLHSDVDTLERIEILTELRQGIFDVLIGINLLREGLDLPEVSLVAILDADREGFLRNARSLIQTVGRAARHIEGRAILYADKVTRSMTAMLDETKRRRIVQEAHNAQHGITPQAAQRAIQSIDRDHRNSDAGPDPRVAKHRQSRRGTDGAVHVDQMDLLEFLGGDDLLPGSGRAELDRLETQMRAAAKALQFEEAAQLRDQIRALKERQLAL
jgi:excinuclease ABC subunit B